MLQIFSHRAPLILLQLRHSCAKGQVVVSSFMLDPVQDCMADHPQISATPSNFGPSTVWPALEVSKMLRWVLKANFRKRVTHDNAHMIIILIAFIFHWHHNYNFAHSQNLKWNYTHNFKCNYTYNWRLAVGLHRGLLLHQPRHSNCWSNSWSGAQLQVVGGSPIPGRRLGWKKSKNKPQETLNLRFN